MVATGGRVAPTAPDRETRARELLLAHLTEEQAHTYVTEGWFRVDLPQPIYSATKGVSQSSFCFHRGRDSVIFTLNPSTGEHEKQLCTHLRGTFDWAVDDIMLAHKLTLENSVCLGLDHGARNIMNASWCDCWRVAHQPPDLRGLYFKLSWCDEPPPPEPGAARRQETHAVRGLGPTQVVFDEMRRWRRR